MKYTFYKYIENEDENSKKMKELFNELLLDYCLLETMIKV